MNKITISTLSLFALIVGNEILTWLILCVIFGWVTFKLLEGMANY